MIISAGKLSNIAEDHFPSRDDGRACFLFLGNEMYVVETCAQVVMVFTIRRSWRTSFYG